jgi:putative phosphoesterase
MRLAILSDIHANLHALQAVWQDVNAQRPDRVYCLGDLVGYGAHPNEVIAFLKAQEVPTVLGNYDEGVGFDLDDCGCAYRTAEERRRGDESLQWTRAHTTPDHKAYLRGLAPNIRLEDMRPHLLLVHGSPRKINEYVFEDRPQATFERLAALAGTDLLLFGHTHLPYQKRIERTLFVNAGSVGKPRGGDSRAVYVMVNLTIDPSVEFRRVEYDVEGAAAAVRGSGLPPVFAELLHSGGVEPLVEDGSS